MPLYPLSENKISFIFATPYQVGRFHAALQLFAEVFTYFKYTDCSVFIILMIVSGQDLP